MADSGERADPGAEQTAVKLMGNDAKAAGSSADDSAVKPEVSTEAIAGMLACWGVPLTKTAPTCSTTAPLSRIDIRASDAGVGHPFPTAGLGLGVEQL